MADGNGKIMKTQNEIIQRVSDQSYLAYSPMGQSADNPYFTRFRENAHQFDWMTGAAATVCQRFAKARPDLEYQVIEA